DTCDALLAADREVHGRAAQHDDHIAGAVLYAIDEDVGADESGGDGNAVFHQVAAEQILRAAVGPEPQQRDRAAAESRQIPLNPSHETLSTGATEKSSVGVATSSIESRMPRASTSTASSTRSISACTRAPTRPPIWAPMTPPTSSTKASTTS